MFSRENTLYFYGILKLEYFFKKSLDFCTKTHYNTFKWFKVALKTIKVLQSGAERGENHAFWWLST